MRSDDGESRKKRAAARATWPLRKLALDQEDGVHDLSALNASERFAMVWRLTQDAWAFRGEPIPDYARSETPIRVIRRRDPA
jgi:hypothetical protein